jgi:WD40 repeat protein/tetratricopeptide (TPR) repeat protein
MARIFISHSSRNNDWAVRVKDWLAANGWDDVFLDLDPERGIIAGQRWKEALQKAAHRCEVVLALVSENWLGSGWCKSEIDAARLMGKKIIVALIGMDKAAVPLDLTDEQWVDLANDPNAWRRLKEGLKRAGLDPSSFPLEPGRRPYPGFACLEEKDAALFFGRDAQIVRGLDKLRGLARTGVERMLVLVGASGSGKSSFLRAGLWPRLKRDDRSWLPLPVIRPERAAMSGKLGLAQALHQVMSEPPFPDQIRALGLPRSRAEIQELIETTGDGLARILAALREGAQVPGVATPPTIVISVDQGEELFNEDGRAEAKRFVATLAATVKADPHVLVLLALRSDAFRQLQAEPGLADLPKDTFILDMMLAGSYRAVIEQPARLVEPTPLKIDPQLIDALLEDVSGQDALPLLAFTLAHLYDCYAVDNELSLAGYEKLGRLRGVIDTTVSEAFAEGAARGELPKEAAAQLALARAAFIPHLAQVNPAGLFVRRVALRDEIPPEAAPLIDRFAARRLLIRDRRKIGSKDAEVIEVAHEALLRQPPFSGWLAEDRDFLVWRERLGQARAAFEANERGALSGRELQIARDWLARRAKADISAADQTFIADSIAEDDRRRAEEAEREHRREIAELQAGRARARLFGMIAAGVLFVIAAAAGTYAWFQADAADRARQEAVRTQMKFLADLSRQETEQGDPGTGLLLALEALPDAASDDAEIRNRQPLALAAASLDQAHRALRERLLLRGHGGAVTAVAITPDGKRVITGSEDRAARVWDAETGAVIAELKGHDGAVTAVALTPDGRVVTASEDDTARIWEASSGSPLAELKGHAAGVTALAVMPDGRIVTGSDDRTARIWTASGAMAAEFKGHDGAITALAVMADGLRLVTAAKDKTVRVWDVRTRTELVRLKDLQDVVNAVAVAVTPDGPRIITGANDSAIRFWDADTGIPRGELHGHEDSITAVMLIGGTQILSGSNDRTARLWDLQTGATHVVARHQAAVTAIAAGGRIVSGGKDGTARIFDPRVRTEIAELKGHAGAVTSVAAIPGGSQVVTGSNDRTARIWDAKTGAELAQLGGHEGPVTSVAVTPGGTRIITGSADRTIRIFDVRTRNLASGWTAHDGAITAIAAMPDGKRLVTGSEDSSVRVWNLETHDRLAEIKGHGSAVTAVAVLPDDRIVTGGSDATVRVWNAVDGSELLQLKEQRGSVTSLAVTPDGGRIVAGSIDRTVRVYDAQSGRELGELKGHQSAVTAVAVTRDGTAIVTGARGGNIRIWSGDTYAELAQIEAHDRFITSLALMAMPERPIIISGAADSTARIWELLPSGQALIDHAKHIVLRCLSPAQRDRYFLMRTPPRWCGTEGKWPYDSPSLLIEGRRLLVDGKEDEAGRLFTEALQRSPADRSAVNATWAAAYLDHARALLAARQDTQAKAAFAEALKRDPGAGKRVEAAWVEAYVDRGRSLLRADKDSEAEAVFAEALQRDPSARRQVDAAWIQVAVGRGRNLLRRGQDGAATAVFAAALRRDPAAKAEIDKAWASAFIDRGRNRLEAQKDEQARALFAEALQRDPFAGPRIDEIWVDALIGRGADLIGEGRNDDAKAALVDALQRDPTAGPRIDEAWVSGSIARAVGLVRDGRDQEAEAAFAEALAHDPAAVRRINHAWAEARIRRAGSLVRDGRDEDARADFLGALERDSSVSKLVEETWVSASVDRGVTLILQGRDDDADAAFAKATSRDPAARARILAEQASAAIERGSQLMAKGREDEARTTFTRALARDPAGSKRINEAWAIAYYELAWAMFVKVSKDVAGEGRPAAEEALAMAEKAVALAPESAVVLDTRGTIRLALGQLDAAFADLDKAIGIGVSTPSSYVDRARCYEAKAQEELAIADYEKALELTAEDDYEREAQAQARARLAELQEPPAQASVGRRTP